MKLFLLGVAGAAGTLARYALSGVVQRISGSNMPWGTFAVNIIGSFFAGFIWAWISQRTNLDPTLRLLLLVGFMGAFTTFSTLMLETGQLVRDAQWLRAAANILAHNLVGFTAVLGGLSLGRLV